MNIFDEHESEVRSYCRRWSTVFTTARGSRIQDEAGRGYLDFFAGAGTLNYGHNNDALKAALIAHIAADGVAHSLDMYTTAKRRFLEVFTGTVLAPRGLDHKVQFTGPTGASAVEAALRLVRKITGRRTVVTFDEAFHGMTLAARSVSDERMHDPTDPVDRDAVLRVPYGTADRPADLAPVARAVRSGAAAVIIETVQCEGGVRPADPHWLSGVAELCAAHDTLLIVDDVQAGCGRTGPFFSFEPFGFVPDIVCVSKALSGFGLPMSLVLVRRELDLWRPGEHSGTFRGNNHAFVTATAALQRYWTDDTLQTSTVDNGRYLAAALAALGRQFGLASRGRGLVGGLVFGSGGLAAKVCDAAFERGLLLETSGPDGEVVKLLPPLTVSRDELDAGIGILRDSVTATA
jgi:diaminobutyrate-2-oxoglutarate transaminase